MAIDFHMTSAGFRLRMELYPGITKFTILIDLDLVTLYAEIMIHIEQMA